MTTPATILAMLEASTKIATEALQEVARLSELGLDDKAVDALEDGVLARAAGCYLVFSDPTPPQEWPLPEKFWRPDCPRVDFIRALALYLLEIAKIDRQGGW